MPFNGSGVYTPPGADFPVVTQTVISSTHFNNTINDIATALSLCLTKDGQQVATANIPFGGFRATNVGITAIAGSVGTPAINLSDGSTGFYRSAVSEIAVSVSGAQVARFASTGLIVTGALSTSTTLTATTSVVTPLVQSASGNLKLGTALDGGDWEINSTTGFWRPVPDNAYSLGDATHRVVSVFTPIIDSGTTGSLSLKTNNGTTQFMVDHIASAINLWRVVGAATGGKPVLYIGGPSSDANVTGVIQGNRGTGTFQVQDGSSGVVQFEFLSVPAATRWVTSAASNGGNPTLGVTAGSLAITPAIAAAGLITAAAGVTLSGGRFQGSSSGVTAANNLTLGNANWFGVGGTTQINLIDNTGWQTGSIITLISYAVSFTVKHGQAPSGAFRTIHLNGAADFAMTDQNTLTLGYDNIENAWYEIGRKTGA